MDTVHAYLAFLICVLRADGVIDDRERTLFYRFLEKMGHRDDLLADFGSSSALDIDSDFDIEATLDEISHATESDIISWMVRDAYYMAHVDGEISDAEVEVIQAFLQRVGIPEDRFEAIDSWGRHHIDHTEDTISLTAKAQELFKLL